MPLLAALPMVLSTAKEIFGVGQALYLYIARLKAAAQQDREWTQDQEDEFDAKVFSAGLDPAWQPRTHHA